MLEQKVRSAMPNLPLRIGQLCIGIPTLPPCLAIIPSAIFLPKKVIATHCVLNLCVAFTLVLMYPAQSRAQTPASTITNLEISPTGSVAPGALVSLTASVASGSSPVSPGMVIFCDATAPHCTDIHILGTAQLTKSGVATLNLVFQKIGAHPIQAMFQGTNAAAGSASTVQTLSVTAQLYPASTSISASGTNGNYSLSGTVTSIGPSLTGTLQFLDGTDGNTSVAEAQLGPEALGFVFLPPTLPPGNYFGSVADFNGDGLLDQAVLSNGNVEIFLGHGDGTFTYKSTINIGSPAFSMALGDFNGDDFPDLVVASQENSTITICFGNGDGTFAAAAPLSISPGYPDDIFVADFNGDGNADLVVASSGMQLFLGDGNGGFSPMPLLPYTPLAVGDFNGDGRADLVVNIPGLAVLLGNPDGTFTLVASNPDLFDAPSGAAVADFNGDGKLDLAETDRGLLNDMTGHIYIFFGNGDGTFALGETIDGWYPEPIAIGDFNGDGIVDFAVGNDSYLNVGVYLGPGWGETFVTFNTSSFLLGDFNNDGRTDLIVGDPYGIVNTTVLSEDEAAATATGVSIAGGVAGFHQVFARYEGNETHRPSSSIPIELTGASAATPIFSLLSGAYPTAQTVYLSDSTTGAALYYTRNGEPPTASSTPYNRPITVTSTETLRAIAIAPNYPPSAIASEAYQIGVSSVKGINFSNGFAGYSGVIQFNGVSQPVGSVLQLTDGGPYESGSAFYTAPVNIRGFSTDFTFVLANAVADGFTFTIQSLGPNAIGQLGGSLGYGRINKSVAIKFDLYNNDGEGSDSTGIYTNGASPILPSVDLTGTGINLRSGDKMRAQITYDGTTLNLTLTDRVTNATWSNAFVIDIPAAVGSNTAYVGFTGGTGGSSATQQILSWIYQATPFYSPTFASSSGLSLNGSASLSAATLELTNGGLGEAGSAFFSAPVNIQSFETEFFFQLTNAVADGLTFTIQNEGPSALGHAGGGLGYYRIYNSVAIKFDLYNNSGEGSDSTGVYTNGYYPATPSVDLTGTGIDLHSGDVFDADITYDGTTLIITLTELGSTAPYNITTWSHSFTIDIPATVGSNAAYVGFTGATGGQTSTQQILSWTFE